MFPNIQPKHRSIADDLYFYVEHGLTDKIEALIATGDPGVLKALHSGLPLADAILQGQSDIVRCLVRLGSPLTVPGKRPVDALEKAIFYGKSDIVSLLVEYGMDVNKPLLDPTAMTPLGYTSVTAEACLVPMIRLLVEAGANVNGTDSRGFTALHYMADRGRSEAAVELLRLGADPFIRTSSIGNDAFQMALISRHLETHSAMKGWWASKQAQAEVQAVSDRIDPPWQPL